MKLVPSNILQRLDKLQKLCVEGCPKIESVVFKDKNEEVADDRTLMPQLWYLRISDMENLKSFYSSSTASNAQSLFNHQVAFPLLENFELEGCASLRYSFHPYMGDLVNLREIIIKHCPEMRAVISTENDKEEEVEDRQQRETKTTMFPNLSKLELHHLQELKLFCHYTRPLEFPLLRQMAICYCPSMDSFSLGHVRALDLSLKGISHKIGKIDSDDTTVTAQKNQEDEEPKNGGKKIFGRISIEEA
ncbi:hypothetical protein RHSIM_Rhsim03G0020600 [Rhododendron simsii]|uniref:Disease resistance protein At4g27190-like leucine-rich repeats domain-containing protein n=1 Tax=Rhododendron simsii TaxID=118357 RepID=A0A834H462_RHOSS|nr:hypothetical protein RHSIM_Rhsim03G0020600 [Rhododendron simsii]